VGELELRFSATDHGPLTLAVRLDVVPPSVALGGGPVAAPADPVGQLVYTADSGPDWSVASLGTGIGTVLCEATYLRDREGTLAHLSGRQAGAMAAAAGVGRLVLTHRWPTVSADELAAEASEAFGRPVDQAAIGRHFEW
jgi:ribonuclease BN (tRNA processing enzyme)